MLTHERLTYLAEKFLTDARFIPVDRRLSFEAWADRQGFGPETKRHLWRAVKAAARRVA
jgi:hypothetical protein